MIEFSVELCCSTPGIARPVCSAVSAAASGTAVARAVRSGAPSVVTAIALIAVGWPRSSGRTASRIARQVPTLVQAVGCSW